MSGEITLPIWHEPKGLADATTQVRVLLGSLHSNAYHLGKTLLWVKEAVGHGVFGSWTAKHVGKSERACRYAMTYAQQCDTAGSLLADWQSKSADSADLKTPRLPSNLFRILYADPPWAYNDQQDTDKLGGAIKHYPPLSIAELCALPIRQLCDEHAVLFLWVTSPLLYEAAPLIGAWGFEYKTSFVWDKIKHNMGHYNSVRHEFLLVCTRGSCTPDVPTLFDSVQAIERSDRHSEKPAEFRRIIDTLYPHGKRLEIFARAPHEHWEVWGNEVGLS